jgi:hypothetical protein
MVTMRALPPATLAAMVANRMRRIRDGAAVQPTAAETASSVQRLLEEGGVEFSTSTGLVDLKGYVIASDNGAEITVSDRLGPEERLDLFAQLLAHALVGTVDARPRTVLAPLWSVAFGSPPGPRRGRQGHFFAHLEYVDGRRPTGGPLVDRRADALATILAEAIRGGHVDLTPRYVFPLATGLEAGHSGTSTGRRGLRATVGRLFLEVCHRTSLALFWRSTRYRRLRANRQVTGIAHQVDGMVRAYLPGVA